MYWVSIRRCLVTRYKLPRCSLCGALRTLSNRTTACLLFEPKEIRRVLVDDEHLYGKTTRGYDVLRLVLGDGLVTSEGDFWLRQRRIAQPAFCRGALRGFGETMVQASIDLAERWKATARVGNEIDMAKVMNDLTLRIAGQTLMSVDLTSEARDISDSMDIAMGGFHGLTTSLMPFAEKWPTPSNRRMKAAIRTLHRVVEQMIKDRRRLAPGAGDLLGMLMETTDPETGEGMTDAQLRDEVLTLLLAGHETTANGLTWTWYLLSKHPLVMAKLQAELDSVLGGRAPNVEDVSRLTYTTQVIKESLRLFPPVWMLARQAREATHLGGYAIEKGAYIFMPIHAIHRDPGSFLIRKLLIHLALTPKNRRRIALHISRSVVGNGSALVTALRKWKWCWSLRHSLSGTT